MTGTETSRVCRWHRRWKVDGRSMEGVLAPHADRAQLRTSLLSLCTQFVACLLELLPFVLPVLVALAYKPCRFMSASSLDARVLVALCNTQHDVYICASYM